jgi:carboxyl-terminal processing protease
MSSRSRVLLFLVSTPIAAMLIVGGLLGAARPAAQQGVSHLRVFDDVVQLITHAYVEDVNVDRVFDGAMRGLSDGLDPSSAYLTPDEVRALDANQPLPAGEVGLLLSRQFYLRIISVRDGSAAKRAGLAEGDFIRAIDDKPTRDLSALAGNRLLRGAPGSKVKLLVFRNSAAEPHTVELTREAVTGAALTSRKLPSGEIYVRVTSFGSGTPAAMRAQLPLTGPNTNRGPLDARLAADPGTPAVIDLRSVGDGTAEDGIAAARLFVKSGTLATRAARSSATPTVTSATEGDGALTMPVVLLVSTGTANAAEVFAAALSNNRRARLVGEPTAGIAGVQRLVRLPEGHGLWLTYAQYLQADGTPIHQNGLRPDVPVEVPSVGFDEAPPATDAILERALADLKSRGRAQDEGGSSTAQPRTAPATSPPGSRPDLPPTTTPR